MTTGEVAANATPRPAARVPSAQARERIVAATGRLLEDRPFRELTVESVMAEAGLARTIFYRHFETLAAAVVALLDDTVHVAPVPMPDLDDPRSLRAMLSRTVDLYARHGHRLTAVEEASHHDPEAARIYADAFERSIQATTALGVPEPTARALMHLNAGYLSDTLARDPNANREQALETLWTIWSRVLRLR